MKLEQHYKKLLGLEEENWNVEKVALDMSEKRVEIKLVHRRGNGILCPICDTVCGIEDHTKERQWRHLDTMQFTTILLARVPRSNCPNCGVKVVGVPWADKYSRFTTLFEAFAISVLECCDTVSAARPILRLSWNKLHSIMKKAVKRGLLKRNLDNIGIVNIDDKSFKKGRDYVTILSDEKTSAVLEVTKDNTKEAANKALNIFSSAQKENIQAINMDMSLAYRASAGEQLPNADIVFDHFHISALINEAVDKTRKKEHKELIENGDTTLNKTKYTFLYNKENMPESHKLKFEKLKKVALKTIRAHALKETFRGFWNENTVEGGRLFFKSWYSWAIRSRISYIKEVARTLKRHLDNILNYFKYRTSNGIAEGNNSKIQFIKAAARGFRNFKNYRTRILFYCGKLNLSM